MLVRRGADRERGGIERASVFLLPLILLLTGMALAYHVAQIQFRSEQEHVRDSIRAELEPVRGDLSRELAGAISLTEGMSGIIAAEGGITGERFQTLARELIQRSSIIRNIALAPNNVISMVHPIAGNERSIGFEYARSSEQWPSVARMMAEQRLVIAGPARLVQGGIGVIGRTPIYVAVRGGAQQTRQYWGLVSTVVDFDGLLGKTNVRQIGHRTAVALRGTDGVVGHQPAFWGEPGVFDNSPVLMTVPLPSGNWELAGMPKEGWAPFRVAHSTFFLVGALLTLTLTVLLFKLLQVGDAREFEVEERRHTEGALRRANRALQLFSQVKGAVVRAKSEESLLSEVCRISVEVAGYRMAWIGRAEHDPERTVRPVAWAGPAEGFLDRIFVSWGENDHGRGTAGIAIRTRAPAVARDLLHASGFEVWKDALRTRNFATAVAVPLIIESDVFGVLLIYATELEAFDDTELGLLEDLGSTISHGMAGLQAQKARNDAMAALERARVELEERVASRTHELRTAKEAAESADRIKSAFLATMSHELRTPLNSIIGFTGILIQGLAGALNQEQTKQLGMVQSSAQHLLKLINDVLDISKIEAGQLRLVSEAFEIQGAVTQALASMRPTAQKKGIELSSRVAEPLPRVLGDQRRVAQVLLNLLSNAIKFTERGSVAVEVQTNSLVVTVSVRDTGIGMSEPDIAGLFQPFHQLESGLTRRHEGTGLGLSICKRLVALMGGTIDVRSALGVGTVFSFSLPVETIPS